MNPAAPIYSPATAASAPVAPVARPASAVSHGVGLAGLAGLIAYLLLARHAPDLAALFGVEWTRGRLSGPTSAIVSVLACALPMVAWSLLVDKVHRNPTTGIDWSRRVPLAAMIDVSIVKLVGLWATWAMIAAAYAGLRYYWEGQYRFSMTLLGQVAVPLVILSVPYVLWLDRKLIEPRDGAHALGLWLVGRRAAADRRAIAHHLRAWTVKGFFTAFMLSIVPGNFAALVDVDIAVVLNNPVALTMWTISLLFLIDVHVATVGYILTMKPLDAHIRTANPYFMGWAAALICYPPFIMMQPGGPLDYQWNTQSWDQWLGGNTGLIVLWGTMLVLLTGIYSWATMAFGIRFSNLTHRGIITHGPYAFTRHPAYVAKNLTWWIGAMPFLVTSGGWIEGFRNTLLMAAVSGVYYWRAKTEEKHLLADPEYRAYWTWAQDHAFVPRLFAAMWRRNRPLVVLEPDDRVGPVA